MTSVFSRDRLAWCLAELGEFAEAMARADEAGRIAREIDHPRSLVVAYRSLGLVSLRRGDLMQAIPPLERAVELCRVIPAPGPLRRLGRASRVRVRAVGAPPRGRGPHGGGARRPRARRASPTIRCSSLTSGRRTSWPAAGTTRSRSPGAPSTSPTARRSAATRRGSCASSARSPCRPTLPTWSQPPTHYGRALARADELGMRPLVAHCHLGLGKLYRRTGDE